MTREQNIHVLNYTKDPQTGTLDILDEDHYYPFGLKHGVYAAANLKGFKMPTIGDADTPILEQVRKTEYQYKYNSKEWQDELGLDMYAMDMRQYDPAIARWVVHDPITHHYQSPYSAFDGNPVFWADPSGAASEHSLWEKENDDSKSAEKKAREIAVEESNTISTTYVNKNTGESVWINDGIDEIVLVSDRLFAKAKVFKMYFGDSYIRDNHSLASKYADLYYESRYGNAYQISLGYWLDSGPKFQPSVIGGSGSLEDLSGGGVIRIGKFVLVVDKFHRMTKPKILKSVAAEFTHIVGKNPDIGVEGGKIILLGAKNGPYKGKKYVTDLNALYYLQ